MTLLASTTRGIAQLLHGVGGLTYRPTGAYTAKELPITHGLMHPTAPVAVCVTAYTDETGTGRDTTVRVQVRVRHPGYLDGLRLLDAIRDTLNDRRYLQLDGINVSHVRLFSFLPLGPDSQGRHEWTQNYRLLCTLPSNTTQKETQP